MDALTAIANRHSTRNFSPRPIARDVLERIVDAGRRAPSANNEQPWDLVVVTDAEVRRQIADLVEYGRFIADVPACVAVFCRPTEFYLEDGCAVTENLLIAATALGVGSCWISGDKRPYAAAVSQILGAPPGHRLIALVPLGYESQAPERRAKRPLSEVVHWERF